MEELILLFLYHRCDALTLRHFELLRKLHPRDQVVPLAYQLLDPEKLPGTIDVELDWDYGWPIQRIWHENDKVYLRWMCRPKRPQARRYVFYEYDILPQVDAPTFYGAAWNADVAAVHLADPELNPEWPWWQQTPKLEEAAPFRRGLVPMAATLWSHEALTRISQTPRFQRCYCELRMGTLANFLGFKAVVIPGAQKSMHWRPESIALNDARTWFHPVKELPR